MHDAIFIIKGRLRRVVLAGLRDKPKTGKRLCKELRRHLTSVSRVLIELKKKKFVKCLNPRADRFRFYQITGKGKRVLKQISEMEK